MFLKKSTGNNKFSRPLTFTHLTFMVLTLLKALFGRPICNSVVTRVNCKTGRSEWIFVESQRPSLLCGVCCQGSVDLRPHGSLRRAWRVMWLYCFSEQEATDSRDAKEPSCAQAQEREGPPELSVMWFYGRKSVFGI